MISRFINNPFLVLSKLICLVRSWYYSNKIDEGNGKIKIQNPFIKFKILKGKQSRLILLGDLIIENYHGLINPIHIDLMPNSTLEIKRNFSLGPGVRIIISPNATLIIGGKEKESGSGITADSFIMVYRKISIGKDFICAWNVFISDSDWHSIEGKSKSDDVSIGNHVWIANSCSILKGAQIGENCIVASHSKLVKGVYSDNSLIAGTPAKVVKSEINWARDI